MRDARRAAFRANAAAREMPDPAKFAALSAGQTVAVAHVAAHDLGGAAYAIRAAGAGVLTDGAVRARAGLQGLARDGRIELSSRGCGVTARWAHHLPNRPGSWHSTGSVRSSGARNGRVPAKQQSARTSARWMAASEGRDARHHLLGARVAAFWRSCAAGAVVGVLDDQATVIEHPDDPKP